MSIDYNKLAKTYDLSRTADMDTLNHFEKEVPLEGKVILDYGCGTGNFAHAIGLLTGASAYGVDPSEEMLKRALEKGIDARKGDHTAIPYDDCFFDFIYMINVIHHVPNLNSMFSELRRVLKPDGRICIITESHEQLATRFWVKHFSSTVNVEKKRYPDIPTIIEAAKSSGLSEYKIVKTDFAQEVHVTKEFVRLAENKGFSMFHLIDEKDYQKGITLLKKDYADGTKIECIHGETLIWLFKEIS